MLLVNQPQLIQSERKHHSTRAVCSLHATDWKQICIRKVFCHAFKLLFQIVISHFPDIFIYRTYTNWNINLSYLSWNKNILTAEHFPSLICETHHVRLRLPPLNGIQSAKHSAFAQNVEWSLGFEPALMQGECQKYKILINIIYNSIRVTKQSECVYPSNNKIDFRHVKIHFLCIQWTYSGALLEWTANRNGERYERMNERTNKRVYSVLYHQVR